MTRCTCDFCTGKKRHEDWCARCANVRLRPDQHWENLDICEQCEREMEIDREAERADREVGMAR